MERFVLDLTHVNNLTKEEKEALTYLISCDTAMGDMVYQSTFEQFEQEGLIIEDENEWLYEI